MREHVFVLTADVQQNYPKEWGSEDYRTADAVTRLRELAAAGIVDVTVIGQGRYIPRIARIAGQVPELNIVVATGCYTFDDVPMFFWRRTPDDEALAGRPPADPLLGFFVRDITDGITGTAVKAGMLQCAVDAKGLTEGVEPVLRRPPAQRGRGSRPGLANGDGRSEADPLHVPVRHRPLRDVRGPLRSGRGAIPAGPRRHQRPG